ncbi:MAG: PAS domain-containing sensor histidine kinase [Marinosulfonomonas sp.]|nr:PAS domain-containing sensor histidine kinase [Marinosulfonomonas sp.]
MVVRRNRGTLESGQQLESPIRSATWDKLSRLRRKRRVQNAATLGLVLLGPALVIATFVILGPLDKGAIAPSLRLILLTDVIYILVVAALVLQRVAQMIAARRARSAGSRLHLHLTGVFALLALIPTVLVAVFAVLTVNVGLEGWFSERVRQVVGTSLAAAQAYQDEHRRDLTQDAQALVSYLNRARQSTIFLNDGDLRELLTQGQSQIQRGLREAYVIDGAAKLRARGDRSYLFDFETPAPTDIAVADAGEIVIIQDWDNNEFRALAKLDAYIDRYLYVSRNVDGDILNLLDDTQETAKLYHQLESERGKLLFEFALLYIGFAVILILAAIWLGLWFAERLARPVGRLAGAAQQVGTGDLDVQVIEETGDDEIAMLGRYFNQMTRQLKGQRNTLLENTRQVERRRRLFDSVLSSVASGVVGLDAKGRVTFVNRSAERLLALPDEQTGDISVAVPEFGPLLKRLKDRNTEVVQEEIKLSREGKLENLLVRISTRRNDRGYLEGYVIAFDDVTDLVSAQRMAAWGDVARRIAHEIKNPLTPIQLSAERLKRKFAPIVGDQAETLEQYTDVIIRQTGDLRRIVDEFSRFARMPEPELCDHDLTSIVRDAVVLQESAMPDVKLVTDFPDYPLMAELDATMISQVMVNLIKNAGEAIESLEEKGLPDNYKAEIHVNVALQDGTIAIDISDNGIGLPEDRARLFEPYVTTRETGTGLGLSIVKKIIEEHGGTLRLTDAEKFEGNAHKGARAEIRLPATAIAAKPETRKAV